MPALTRTKLENHALHAIGGVLDARLSVTDLVNEAGERLVNMHPWNWLQREPTDLSLTADQKFVTLPTDFRDIVAIHTNSSVNNAVYLTTMDDIITRRGSQISITQTDYWAALAWPTQASTTSAPTNPRLELWPTPNAAVANAWSLVYRAQWVPLAAIQDVPNIPTWLNPLLIQFVRAVAMGYEDGDVETRCAQVEQGSSAYSARSRDGTTQPTYGPPLGGHLEPPPAVVPFGPVIMPS